MSTRSDKLRARWANPEMRQRLLEGIKRARQQQKEKPKVERVPLIISGRLPLNTLVTWYSEYVPPKHEELPGTYFNQRFGRISYYEGQFAVITINRFFKPLTIKVKVDRIEEVKN